VKKKFSTVFALLFCGWILVTVFTAVRPVRDPSANSKNVPLREMSIREKASPYNPEKFIELIFQLAENGRLPDFPFRAGQSSRADVIGKWGLPETANLTRVGYYVEYPKYRATIGFRNFFVQDLRTDRKELASIAFTLLKKVAGEPSEQRYYKDEEVDQILLVYRPAREYELKWVFPRPTAEEPDPSVHHISLLALKPESQALTADEQVGQMSLEEKIGQMVFAGFEGQSMSDEVKHLIKDLKVGGIILYKENLSGTEQSIRLINRIKLENLQNPIPLFFGIDQEGGAISRLPGGLLQLPANREIGLRNDPNLSRQIGKILALELKSFGMNINFAPVLDVVSNPNNRVIGERSLGSDPHLVAELGTAIMKGMQDEGAIPVVKHFPGHGDTETDSHLELPVIHKSYQDLNSLEFIPFRKVIEEKADCVMVAHILLPEIAPEPASLSDKIINGILRKDLGFDGVVISDDLTMGAITRQYSVSQAAVKAVQAGTDIVLVAHGSENVEATVDALLSAVRSGEIPEEQINTSVRRILRLKEKYGISDATVPLPDPEKINQLIRDVLKLL
jgi:Glycosyl hydrolase family 3 N terminal domain.